MLHQVPGFEADSDRFLAEHPLAAGGGIRRRWPTWRCIWASDESSFSTGSEFVVDGGGLA